MKRSIALIALLVLPLVLLGQHDSIISIRAGTRNIEGTMLLPESQGNVPMVLIIPGSGPIDRDGNHSLMNNNSLKMLAEGLFDSGIASLRYDKRGVKGNLIVDQKEADIRFEDFVQDARYWISNLEDLKGIGPVHVLGHSQGSLVAILAAQGTDVRSVISLAGGGLPLEDVIRIQLEEQPPVLQEHANIILDSLRQGLDVKRVHPMLQSLFRPSVQPFMRSWMQYDPRIEIAKLDQPVLILNGTEDIQVSVDQAEKLHAASPKSELVILEKMNHVLKEVEGDRFKNMGTYYDPDLPLFSKLVPAIAEFIKSQ